MAAGANGICVATVGEAEAMAAAGIRDILITSTLSQPSKMRRATSLAKSGVAVTMIADDPGLVDQLQALSAEASARLDVLVDVDLGRKRNGVTTIEQARSVAMRIASSPALTMKGVQAYASHISHIETFAERDAAARQSAATITSIRSALEADGHAISCVSGGSTGTLLIDFALHCYSELQCGSSQYFCSNINFITFKINNTIFSFMASPNMTGGYSTIIISSACL